MKMMWVLRAVVVLLVLTSLLLMIGLWGSGKGDLDRQIDQFAKPYEGSIFSLYEDKIYASVPSNGNYPVAQADVATFRPLSQAKGYQAKKVAVDKNHVYAGNLIVPNLDLAKTIDLGNDYYSDGQHTYYLGSNSSRNDDLNVAVEIFQLLLYGLNLGDKPQTYLYPIAELPRSPSPYYPLLENAVASDGKAVFFQGQLLPQADPATLRQLDQVYDDGDKRPSYDYFADQHHVYYKNELLPLPSNADIYSLEIAGNSVESYLIDPRSGAVFMHELAFPPKNAPYQLITPYGAHVYHALFSAKEGIYFYDRETKTIKRAGNNPFAGAQFSALSEFVFTDGKRTLFLDSTEQWSGGRKRRLHYHRTEIKELPGTNAALWQNLGNNRSGFGGVWQNGDKLFYFDNLGHGQLIDNSIYAIDSQQTAKTLLKEDLRSSVVKDLIDNHNLTPVEGKSVVSATSKYGSTFPSFWLLLLALGIFPIVTFFQRRNNLVLAPFIIKDDQLQMLSLFAKSFQLTEIRQVVFTPHYYPRSGHSAKMQVVLKNGERSRHYLFAKTVGRDSEVATRDFISDQQALLRAHGVDSVVQYDV